MSFSDDNEMFVIKRNGKREIVSFDKILQRIKNTGLEADININYTTLTMKVIDQLYDGITTTQIDELTSDQCAYQSSTHPDYNALAGRIVVSNLQKNTLNNFSSVVDKLYNFTDKHGTHSPIISEDLYQNTIKNASYLDDLCDYSRDYLIDFFGLKTLERAYLLKIDKVVVERPQHMWLRVAIGIHGTDLDRIKETYDCMSLKYFTHATPTLFNAGTPRPQLSSCFLLAMESDSMNGIYNTLNDCAMISKWAGGIGLHIHNVRATGSYIRGTNGHSTGIVPMLRVFNTTAKYVDQGNKRNGSFAIYLEPWHADIEIFLQLRKNHGDEELRARDLFYALWIPDLFMERVKSDGDWTLMCPDECKGLSDVYGEQFKTLYEGYENDNKGRITMKARKLWFQMLDAQMETGTPYLCYKDAANRKSNQKNIGIIKSSNLCTEIMQVSTPEETAVCNLASIALPAFIDQSTNPPTYNFDKLHDITKIVLYNINKVIDVNYYPTSKAKNSNMKHRPVGIGCQGLADTFILMNMPFDSPQAKQLNILIFETIYHATLEQSCELAKVDGYYESFIGSPASLGELQYDMWGVVPTKDRYDWDHLKEQIKIHGLRNSLMVAPMPTASTSQILGYNECIEPITSNIYSRRTLAGEFIMANKYLIRELTNLGLWDAHIKNSIIANHGSIQHIETIPSKIRAIYKTVWEIPMRTLIDMTADRGAYVCQSQSLNLWLEDPNYSSLTSMHFYAWEKGLKTGIYYLRRRGRHQAQQFTIEPVKGIRNKQDEEICEMCSS
jgi:ribonucleoside-diphosphate reductase alpha subunit